ncbi:MAG: DNA polymerase III subunit alpha, partial [Clostridiales bacterium]|nr:DNA polymerase III subunit alpha [Clostridiales bacterium]
AGSLAAYCIGITGIDPIRYNLLFERFLNPERVSMPDFDIDFCYERRQEVIDYVVRKYGADHVAQIVTFGTMAARGSLRDVGRALGIPYSVVDSIAKLVPMDLHMTLDKALKGSADFRNRYETDEQAKELIDTARKVEGMPRHSSTHAAGVVITHQPVYDYVPLIQNEGAGVTQFTMTTLEELGLLKMDFLGLRNLTVLHDASEMVRRIEPDFDLEKISLEDKEVFEMLAVGQTDGVFQFESAGMRQVLVQLGPESLEDMIAVISLYRPGPMESIPRYIDNRHHPEHVTYRHPLLKDILEVTNGCMVYQEQVMQVFRTLAGYSYGRADIVRRAMSKKKHDVMEQERQNFIYGLEREDGSLECEGAVRRGVPAEVANAIFDEMASFASYAFNKSHAAAYALVAYQTAYMKCHYPREYMAALLTSILDSTNKVSGYIGECTRLGIKVLPPSINDSFEYFSVSGQDIRFGLLAVRNVGRGFLKSVISERTSGGKFVSFYDFCKRMHGKDLNRRTLESLVKCGALDGLGANRRQMLASVDMIISSLDAAWKRNVEGQIGLFDSMESSAGEPDLPRVPELPAADLLNMEKETTGLYLSGHPMADYAGLARRLKTARIGEILEQAHEASGIYKDGQRVKILAIVDSVRLKITKSNATMAFVTIEDLYGSMVMLVFPQLLTEHGAILQEGKVLLIRGRISVREDEDATIICEGLELPPSEGGLEADQSAVPKARAGLYLTAPSRESREFRRALKITGVFEGRLPLYVKFLDTGKKMKAPANLWVDPNEPMKRELARVLGDENVLMISE